MILGEVLKNYNVILASMSARRRELLESAGIKFTLAEAFECEESYPEGLETSKVAEYISNKKAECYPNDLKDRDILITADTTVVVEEQILGKPKDYAHAFEMLKSLSGRSHEVVTAFTIKSEGRVVSESVSTKVWFRELSDEEIDYYIVNYKPFDKAGAYGIQEWIGAVGIEKIDGSYYNVVGLPMQRLYAKLKEIFLV